MLSWGVIFFLFLWSAFLSFFGHCLVKGVIACKKASAHRPCFLLSFFCFIALLVFFIFAPPHFFFTEFIFLSLLITISASDFCTFFIPTLLTLGFIPIGCISAWYNYLPITFTESIIGTIFGYGVLQIFSHIYKKRTGIQGIGEGDFDMLALVGAFTGFYGVWSALTIGSALGSCLGIIYYLKDKTFLYSPFPFGPLLALGSYCYLIYSFIQY